MTLRDRIERAAAARGIPPCTLCGAHHAARTWSYGIGWHDPVQELRGGSWTDRARAGTLPPRVRY